MRKNISYLAILLLTISLLMLTGCDALNPSEEGGEIDTALVGVWFWDDNSGFEYVFYEDGTGIRGWPGEASPFTWSTRGSTLNILCQGETPMFRVRNERWTYTLTNDRLRLTSQQSRNMSYSYIRDGVFGDVEQELVGTWFWDESIFWTRVFHEDGTGTAGWTFEKFEFIWGVTGNVLRIERLGELPKYTNRIDTWRFYIEDGLLHITGPDGDAFSYYMDYRNWEADPVLVDTWAWDDYTYWVYVFNEDGTASQGPYYNDFDFAWGTYGNELRFFYDGILFDSWFFSVTGDNLRLEMRYDSYTVFYYTRLYGLDGAHQGPQNAGVAT